MTKHRTLQETIQSRRSVRTFTGGILLDAQRRQLEMALRELNEQYKEVSISLQDNTLGDGKLGTYGIIRRAPSFLTLVCRNTPEALLQAGISGEKAVIFCTALGLGTVWLAGTFNRGQFMRRIEPNEDKIIPAVIAVGIPAEKTGTIEGLMRRVAKSDDRKSWNELFFENDTSHFLPREDDLVCEALEMVRLAPSASNKQPWRVVKIGELLHFYLARTAGYAKMAVDIQMLDMGIGMSHFEMMWTENRREGRWVSADPELTGTESLVYVKSWSTGKPIIDNGQFPEDVID